MPRQHCAARDMARTWIACQICKVVGPAIPHDLLSHAAKLGISWPGCSVDQAQMSHAASPVQGHEAPACCDATERLPGPAQYMTQV